MISDNIEKKRSVRDEMQRSIRIATISDRYIEYLKKFDDRVMDNKPNDRKFKRKYLWLTKHNGWNYFIPESSPKLKDYHEDGTIRKDVPPIVRIGDEDAFFGTLHIGNMIPVPDSEIEWYDSESEKDSKYRKLRELRDKNTLKKISLIVKYEREVYNNQVTENQKPYVLDYKKLEKRASQFRPAKK